MTSQAQADGDRQDFQVICPDTTEAKAVDTLIAGRGAKWVRSVGRNRFLFLRVGSPKWLRFVLPPLHAPPAPFSNRRRPSSPGSYSSCWSPEIDPMRALQR